MKRAARRLTGGVALVLLIGIYSSAEGLIAGALIALILRAARRI